MLTPPLSQHIPSLKSKKFERNYPFVFEHIYGSERHAVADTYHLRRLISFENNLSFRSEYFWISGCSKQPLFDQSSARGSALIGQSSEPRVICDAIRELKTKHQTISLNRITTRKYTYVYLIIDRILFSPICCCIIHTSWIFCLCHRKLVLEPRRRVFTSNGVNGIIIQITYPEFEAVCISTSSLISHLTTLVLGSSTVPNVD